MKKNYILQVNLKETSNVFRSLKNYYHTITNCFPFIENQSMLVVTVSVIDTDSYYHTITDRAPILLRYTTHYQ